MVRRHPHVFGTVKAGTSAQVLKNWEEIKAEERKAEKKAKDQKPNRSSRRCRGSCRRSWRRTRSPGGRRISGSIGMMPAGYSTRSRKNRSSCALRFTISASQESANGGPAKSQTNISQGRGVHEEVGDLLFAAVNMARFLGLDAEVALKSANRKFRERFGWMERQAAG
jgi:ATP diphosphatase